MLQALGWAAIGTGFTFLMTTLGAAVVFFFVEEPRPQFQRTMLGFAAGVMTAASVWSLLLPAIEQSADFGVPGWLPAAVGLLLGVCFLAALDAALPHLGIISVFEGLNEGICLGALREPDHILHRRVLISPSEIFLDRSREKDIFLEDHADALTQVF